MRISSWCGVGLAIAVLLVTAILGAWNAKAGPSASGSDVAVEPSTSGRLFPPAANLRIQVRDSNVDKEALLDLAAPAWNQAPPASIILNRTPRIYPTEPARDIPAPRCEVRALRSGGKLILRLAWDDKTRNAPETPPAKTVPQSRERPDQLYKRPTGETSAFADAAAVMVPDDWQGPSFPSLLMGDKHSSVHLYYWNASRGAAELTASGRATPQPSGQAFPYRANHTNDQWIVTMELPDQREGYPVAFAVWDGATGDRDGLKFFSVWHVLTGK
jgi:hypothetical protein